jgi:diguanylate cyclase (GGDEF)-like protein/PAS domain S-box-containing protein
MRHAGARPGPWATVAPGPPGPVGDPPESVAPGRQSRAAKFLMGHPRTIAVGMAPAALAVLLTLRHFHLVAQTSPWLYTGALVSSVCLSYLTDRIVDGHDSAPYIHLRVASNVISVTLVIYISGWGPEIVGGYAFVLIDNVARSGAKTWKIVSLWSVIGIAVGQIAVSTHLAPTFIPIERANALAALGTFLLLFISPMLGSTAERKELAESALRSSEERFRSLVQHSYDTILVLTENSIIFASPAIEGLIGRSPEDIIGLDSMTLVHPEERERVAAQIVSRLENQDRDPLVVATPLQFRMQHADGTWRHVEANVSDLRDRPAVGGYVANLRDITDRTEAQEALEHQALHDPLTGLPNRALLGDRIAQAILRGQRTDARGPVVMFLDLDRFKLVNDSLGHAAGDKVLVEVAERLKGIMRAADTLARFGGDEFVMLCEQIEDSEALFVVAERVLGALEAPFVLGDKQFRVGGSIGAAMSEGEELTADELLSDADSAMYLAKTMNGRFRIQIFDRKTRTVARHRVNTEHELFHALDNNELVVFYQPIVDLWTRRRVGVEALVRWQHPKRGLLAPAEFLEVAEHTGLIVPMGSWVLRTSCAQVREWNSRLSADHQLSLSVNLSARQLAEPDLVDDVSSVLVEAGISPRGLRLVLDLTDNLHPIDADEALTHVRQLNRIGVDLAIDDFGTGYSSLQYMRELPIRVVKIDRSFISAIGRSARDETIVRSIVDLAHNLDLTVIAEGVETESQLEFISEIGCDMAQGFLFGAPESADEFDIYCRTIQVASASATVDA